MSYSVTAFLQNLRLEKLVKVRGEIRMRLMRYNSPKSIRANGFKSGSPTFELQKVPRLPSFNLEELYEGLRMKTKMINHCIMTKIWNYLFRTSMSIGHKSDFTRTTHTSVTTQSIVTVPVLSVRKTNTHHVIDKYRVKRSRWSTALITMLSRHKYVFRMARVYVQVRGKDFPTAVP